MAIRSPKRESTASGVLMSDLCKESNLITEQEQRTYTLRHDTLTQSDYDSDADCKASYY